MPKRGRPLLNFPSRVVKIHFHVLCVKRGNNKMNEMELRFMGMGKKRETELFELKYIGNTYVFITMVTLFLRGSSYRLHTYWWMLQENGNTYNSTLSIFKKLSFISYSSFWLEYDYSHSDSRCPLIGHKAEKVHQNKFRSCAKFIRQPIYIANIFEYLLRIASRSGIFWANNNGTAPSHTSFCTIPLLCT